MWHVYFEEKEDGAGEIFLRSETQVPYRIRHVSLTRDEVNNQRWLVDALFIEAMEVVEKMNESSRKF